ncbi:MAG: hypothetical protein ACRC0G_07740 [Fusobacteriaceae bacterium]
MLELRNIVRSISTKNPKISEYIIENKNTIRNFLTLADFLEGTVRSDAVTVDIDPVDFSGNADTVIITFENQKDLNKMIKYNQSSHSMFEDYSIVVECQHIDKNVLKLSIRR